MKWISNIILTVLCTGIWGPGYAQCTFKETTNSYKFNVITGHFMPLFHNKGGYSNFRTDSTSSSEWEVKVPKLKGVVGKVKGEAMFFYELDTLASVKKIWIGRLKIANTDVITFLDQNHIGFELEYLKEVDFDRRRKNLAVFLLENEWATRRFRRQKNKEWFDKELGNEYIHLLRVKFESED